MRLGYTSVVFFLSPPTFWEAHDQPEPRSFFPRSLWGGGMKDPANEVVWLSPHRSSQIVKDYISQLIQRWLCYNTSRILNNSQEIWKLPLTTVKKKNENNLTDPAVTFRSKKAELLVPACSILSPWWTQTGHKCQTFLLEVIERRLHVKSLILARVKSNKIMFYYHVKDT